MSRTFDVDRGHTEPAIPRRIRCALAATSLTALLGCAGQTGSTSESPTTHNSPLTLLVPSSSTIDLGIVPQAGSEQETFSLQNPGTEPVEIAGFETSCACLEIDLPRRAIAPSEKVLARAMLDLAKEPQFLGNLGIEVKGLTSNGEVAFSIVVEVSVRRPEEFERSDGDRLLTTDY